MQTMQKEVLIMGRVAKTPLLLNGHFLRQADTARDPSTKMAFLLKAHQACGNNNVVDQSTNSKSEAANRQLSSQQALIVETMRKLMAEKNINGSGMLEHENRHKIPLVHSLAEAGLSEFVDQMIDNDPSLLELKCSEKKTLLHYAIESGNPALTLSLVKKHSDFLTSKRHDYVKHALAHNAEDVAKTLVACGAQFDVDDTINVKHRKTPITKALGLGCRDSCHREAALKWAQSHFQKLAEQETDLHKHGRCAAGGISSLCSLLESDSGSRAQEYDPSEEIAAKLRALSTEEDIRSGSSAGAAAGSGWYRHHIRGETNTPSSRTGERLHGDEHLDETGDHTPASTRDPDSGVEESKLDLLGTDGSDL